MFLCINLLLFTCLLFGVSGHDNSTSSNLDCSSCLAVQDISYIASFAVIIVIIAIVVNVIIFLIYHVKFRNYHKYSISSIEKRDVSQAEVFSANTNPSSNRTDRLPSLEDTSVEQNPYYSTIPSTLQPEDRSRKGGTDEYVINSITTPLHSSMDQ